MCSKLSFGKTALWLLPVLLWPFSDLYYDFVLFGLQYIPHLAMMFCCTGLFCAIVRTEKHSRLYYVAWALLAFLNGMGGLRLIVVFYAPLWIAALLSYIIKPEASIRKAICTPQITCSTFGIITAAAGYVVNGKVLPKFYTFANWEGTEFIKPDFAKLNRVLNDVLLVMGYRSERKIISISGFVNLLILAACVVIVYFIVSLLKNYKRLREDEQILTVFTGFSFLATIFVNIFTNQNWASRYLILPMIWFIVLAVVYIRLNGIKKPLNQLIYAGLLVTLPGSGMVEYQAWKHYNKNAAREVVLRFLESEGYGFGYASWDNADVLTEMTDGRIRTCKVTNWKDFSIWYWLMDKNYKQYAEGQKVFVLLNNNEFDYNGEIGYLSGTWEADDLTYLKPEHLVYQDECYTVYSFDDYRNLEQRKQ